MTQSAHGLFRATGKRARPVRRQMLDGEFDASPQPARAADDFMPTPPEPTIALCHYERRALARFPLIWEPACGDGRMMRDLESCGHAVVGSDLRDRGCAAIVQDFFAFTAPLAPCIVTNPPYNKVNARDGRGEWIWHAMERLGVDYMALLLNWSWPGAGGLARLWEAWPPSVVYLMRWKIDFTGGGAPPMLNAWFVWDRARPPLGAGLARLAMMDRVPHPTQEALL